jgi:hypothetical protein
MIRPLKADLLIPEQLSNVIVRPCERIMRYAKEGAVCHLLHDAIDRLCGGFDVAREQPRIFCGFFDILFIGHPFNMVTSGFSKVQPSKNYGCEWFFSSRNHIKDGLIFYPDSSLANPQRIPNINKAIVEETLPFDYPETYEIAVR